MQPCPDAPKFNVRFVVRLAWVALVLLVGSIFLGVVGRTSHRIAVLHTMVGLLAILFVLVLAVAVGDWLAWSRLRVTRGIEQEGWPTWPLGQCLRDTGRLAPLLGMFNMFMGLVVGTGLAGWLVPGWSGLAHRWSAGLAAGFFAMASPLIVLSIPGILNRIEALKQVHALRGLDLLAPEAAKGD